MATNSNPIFLLLVLFLCLFLNIHYSVGADTISANQSVYGYSTVVSAGGIFELGFFTQGQAGKYYIGMWYKNDPLKTILWVANRDKAVSLYDSELKISGGNLVLFNKAKIPVWSTNVTTSSPSSSSVKAVLLENGNLVLTDGSSNSSELLWQSFDHPTHTWLPGSKLGFNKKTNATQFLTSWKNSEDPASGLFSLHFNPSDSSFILRWNSSKSYWTSGSWDGEIFSLIPEMRLYYMFNISYVSNENESYFTYTVNRGFNLIPIFVMDVWGQVKQLSWEIARGWNTSWSIPQRQCNIYAFCGAYGSCNEKSLPFCSCLTGFQPKSQSDWNLTSYSGGCFRQTKLQCKSDKFQQKASMSLPDNMLFAQAGSAKECESACLSNCSCTAYFYDSIGCLIWMEDLLNMQQLDAANSSGKNLFIRLAASELQKPENRKNQEVGLYDTESLMKDFMHAGQLREDDKKGLDVPFVVLESIIAATDNFSEANKLGRGGFGPVYKGKFPGGKEMAIKKLSSCSGQGLEEFKNEVLLIAKLQHRNLVRLLGYCVEGDEKMLLYEYMPNKSLDCFLFDGALCVLLDWKMRFSIILGIARGLVYLHHDSRLRIIHRDLKASNILLDEDMNPKISDFGLARIFGGKQTEASTRRVVGTYGYMSPEYALDGIFSIKSDVFSFGVVILEIISGKRNSGFYQTEETLSLLGYAWKLWKENRTVDLMDATLHETCNTNEFLRCFNVGLLCVQEDPSDRPTISDVVSTLGSETAILPRPKQPAFVFGRSLSSAAARSKLLSVNEITVSTEQGR
ncbi:hypothetical protein UlMin_014299 [Ulmus minor]